MLEMKSLLGETSKYDKKEILELQKPKSWLKSVSAFANSFGGMLLWGISDKDECIGLKDAVQDAEKISEFIKDRMDPIPQFELRFEQMEGKDVICLNVYKGMETPYYYVGDGSRTAYIRIGNQSVQAKAHDLNRLVLNGVSQTYDSIASPYRFADYSFDELKKTYHEQTQHNWKKSDYQSFGLVLSDGMLTNAGALLADASPVRCSRVFCTRWNGLDIMEL